VGTCCTTAETKLLHIFCVTSQLVREIIKNVACNIPLLMRNHEKHSCLLASREPYLAYRGIQEVTFEAASSRIQLHDDDIQFSHLAMSRERLLGQDNEACNQKRDLGLGAKASWMSKNQFLES
jgi:hypothetical protein